MPPVRKQETIERDAYAVELREKNMTYRQIAKELGFSSPRSAYEAVQRGNADAMHEPIDDARRLALNRLDRMARVAWKILEAEHYVTTTTGKIVEHPRTGEPIPDPGPVLAALDRISKFDEAKRKLLGLDAPVKTVTLDAIDAELSSLDAEAAELDRLEAEQAATHKAKKG